MKIPFHMDRYPAFCYMSERQPICAQKLCSESVLWVFTGNYALLSFYSAESAGSVNAGRRPSSCPFLSIKANAAS